MSQMTTRELLEKYPRPWEVEHAVPWRGEAESMWFEIRASNGSILSSVDGKPVRFQGSSDAVLDPELVNVCLSAINARLILGSNSQTDSVESRGSE